MPKSFLPTTLIAVLFTLAIPAGAQPPLREQVKDMEIAPHWIYDDLPKALAEAKQTGKPLMVVVRCVPCLACAGIDAQVLKQAELDLAPLLDQFVCVRLINANAIDLSLFQFDYDLSFSTVFFNADGTVYGRYGSWKHQKDPADKTVTGYTQALKEKHYDFLRRYVELKVKIERAIHDGPG